MTATYHRWLPCKALPGPRRNSFLALRFFFLNPVDASQVSSRNFSSRAITLAFTIIGRSDVLLTETSTCRSARVPRLFRKQKVLLGGLINPFGGLSYNLGRGVGQ